MGTRWAKPDDSTALSGIPLGARQQFEPRRLWLSRECTLQRRSCHGDRATSLSVPRVTWLLRRHARLELLEPIGDDLDLVEGRPAAGLRLIGHS